MSSMSEPSPFNNDTYQVPVFVNTPSIKRIHSKARFGKTNDISALINGSSDDKKDYVKGLVIASVVIFCIFLVWCILLLSFKCLGPKRVGFLSGHAIKKPKPLEDTDDDEENEKVEDKQQQSQGGNYSLSFYQNSGVGGEEVVDAGVPAEEEEEEFNYDEFTGGSPFPDTSDDEKENSGAPQDAASLSNEGAPEGAQEGALVEKWNRENKRATRTLIAARVIVLSSCLGIIVASILFLVYGVDGLVKTVNKGREALRGVEDVANEAISIIDTYLAEQNQVKTSAVNFLNQTEAWCPNLREEILDNCGDNLEQCDFSSIPFQEGIDQVRNFMDDTSNLVFNEIVALRGDLEEVVDITQDIDQTAENFNWAFYVSAGFVVLLDLLVIVYAYGVIQAWRDKKESCIYRITRSFFIVPLLVLIMFMAWLFSIIFLIGAMATADFCVDSPDPNLVQILENNKDRFASVVFKFAIYILQGCPDGENPLFVVFGEQIRVLLLIVDGLRDLLASINEADTSAIQQLCGATASAINRTTTVLGDQLTIIEKLLLAVGVFFSCGTFHPIYSKAAYDAVCYTGVDGLTWIFSSQLTIAVLSMVIVTFRAAAQKSEAYNVVG